MGRLIINTLLVFLKCILLLLYDFIYIRKNVGTWATWTSLIEAQSVENSISYAEPIITTNETVRIAFFLNKLLEMRKMPMIVGPTGTGKTEIIKSYLHKLPKDEYLVSNLNFSARTTSTQTQEIILSQLTR